MFKDKEATTKESNEKVSRYIEKDNIIFLSKVKYLPRD